MRIALPIWNGRISPLFDSATQLLVVEVSNSSEARRWEVALGGGSARARAKRLAGLGIDILICGGISTSCIQLLESEGIAPIPWIA